MRRYPSHLIPENYRNPSENIWLIPCWDKTLDIEVIDVPDDWPYLLPELDDSFRIFSIIGEDSPMGPFF